MATSAGRLKNLAVTPEKQKSSQKNQFWIEIDFKNREEIFNACKKINLEFEGSRNDLKGQLTAIAKKMTRDQLTALGFKFAYSIPLQPDPKLAAATKRVVTSAFIKLILSQSEEKM